MIGIGIECRLLLMTTQIQLTLKQNSEWRKKPFLDDLSYSQKMPTHLHIFKKTFIFFVFVFIVSIHSHFTITWNPNWSTKNIFPNFTNGVYILIHTKKKWKVPVYWMIICVYLCVRELGSTMNIPKMERNECKNTAQENRRKKTLQSAWYSTANLVVGRLRCS